MSYRIINGDSAQELKKLADNSIDAVVTDPPYGIEFLAKEWDSNTGAVEIWSECLRVLKPGGYLLAFSAARTYHHLATNIESVGFEIRDQIMWLYASGFPKAQDIGKAIDRRMGKKDLNYGTTTTQTKASGINSAGHITKGSRKCNKCQKDVAHQYECNDTQCGMKYNYGSEESKQWAGWKTALKPAHEPICMARKPFKGSTIDNVLTHGVGALNIDASRIPFQNDKDQKSANGFDDKYEGVNRTGGPTFQKDKPSGGANGFSRLEFGEKEPAKYRDQKPHGSGKKNDDGTYTQRKQSEHFGQGMMPTAEYIPNTQGRFPSNVLGEVAGYQKFFYCPKVSRKERHKGFDNAITKNDMLDAIGGYFVDSDGNQTTSSNMCYVPGPGKIYVHGLKHEYEKIMGKQDPLPDRLCGPGGNDWVKAQEHQGNNKKDPLTHMDNETADRGIKGDFYSNNIADYGHNTKKTNVGNNHPTVKPVELMKYLVQLVTPQGAHVLDPFCGSGSTGMACKELGNTFTGIEQDKNYVSIAQQRIDATLTDPKYTLFE